MTAFLLATVTVAAALILGYTVLAGGFCLSALADLTAEKARCMRIGNDAQERSMAERAELQKMQLEAQNQLNQAAVQQLGVPNVAN